MTTKFQYIKLFVENAKVIIPLIIMLCTALGWTITDSIQKDEDLAATQEQVTAVANHLSKKTHIVKKVIIRDKVNEHIQEYHK